MDPNKKFLYFNPDENDSGSEGSQQNACVLPVSTFAGMETTTTSNLRMYFKESVETDTLDVTLLRTSDSDPRDAMEFIVNQINFSKDSVLKIADDFAGETIHPDVKQVTSVEFADHSSVKFQKRVVSSITSANPAGGGSPVRATNVGEFNSEIITTIFVDLAPASGTISYSFDTDGDAIGKDASTDPAYITQLEEDVNGYVYKGEFICLEAPAGGDTHVGIYANSSGAIVPGGAANEHAILAPVAQSFGKLTNFTVTSGLNDNDYLYVVQGNTQAKAQYTAGKFLIRLYGFKTSGL
jgi:hypothetical protein